MFLIMTEYEKDPTEDLNKSAQSSKVVKETMRMTSESGRREKVVFHHAERGTKVFLSRRTALG